MAGTNLASLSELIATAVVLILGSCTAGDLVHRKGKLTLQNDASGLTLTSWIDYGCIHQLVLLASLVPRLLGRQITYSSWGSSQQI